MTSTPGPIVFGPVPSRRLGRSLGVSTIPPKVCSYSCAYCQVGRTTLLQVSRSPFYDPAQILARVEERLAAARKAGERVDYVSLVPDGEPTLDSRIGETIGLLRTLGIPVAVITNASILWRNDVCRDLAAASWVSVKVDAVRERAWRRLNHPHRSLRLEDLLDGMLRFRRSFAGSLVSETMMVEGINDTEEDIDAVAAFLHKLKPSMAYLSVPTRPPVDSWVRPAHEAAVIRAHQAIAASGQPVEILAASEGLGFSGCGQAAADLLAITAVHPMRREAVEELLAHSGAGWDVVRTLVREGRIVQTTYRGESFLVRRFASVSVRETREQRGEPKSCQEKMEQVPSEAPAEGEAGNPAAPARSGSRSRAVARPRGAPHR